MMWTKDYPEQRVEPPYVPNYCERCGRETDHQFCDGCLEDMEREENEEIGGVG